MGQGRVQLALCCPCGRPEILALGLCTTYYTLKQQDEEYFGGLRETVLERDGHRCRGCGAPGREKRSIIVHHCVTGVSTLDLMISLCPGCHAEVERTRMVLAEMNSLLLELWREQHPDGQEQIMLAFSARESAAQTVPLAPDDSQDENAPRGNSAPSRRQDISLDTDCACADKTSKSLAETHQSDRGRAP
jgi:hypothetical protein